MSALYWFALVPCSIVALSAMYALSGGIVGAAITTAFAACVFWLMRGIHRGLQ